MVTVAHAGTLKDGGRPGGQFGGTRHFPFSSMTVWENS